MKNDELVKYKELILKRVKIGIMRYISGSCLDDLRTDAMVNYVAEGIKLSFLSYIAAGRKHRMFHQNHEYPADWWQALRERWFPRWWLDRHPVVSKTIAQTIEITHVCPHVNIQWWDPEKGEVIPGCPERAHLDFLALHPDPEEFNQYHD